MQACLSPRTPRPLIPHSLAHLSQLGPHTYRWRDLRRHRCKALIRDQQCPVQGDLLRPGLLSVAAAGLQQLWRMPRASWLAPLLHLISFLLLLPGGHTVQQEPQGSHPRREDVGVIVPSISGVARASFFQYASQVRLLIRKS